MTTSKHKAEQADKRTEAAETSDTQTSAKTAEQQATQSSFGGVYILTAPTNQPVLFDELLRGAGVEPGGGGEAGAVGPTGPAGPAGATGPAGPAGEVTQAALDAAVANLQAQIDALQPASRSR
jgi:hypothetical protein